MTVNEPGGSVAPASRSRRRRRDAEENSTRILDAARQVFAARGVATSIEVVAEQSGLGLGTIYRHFANKEALINELARQLLEAAVEIAERHVASGEDALCQYLWEVAELLGSQPGIIRTIWNFPGSEALTARSRTAQADLLRRAQQAGSVRGDLVPEDVAVALFAITGVLDIGRNAAVSGWQRHLEAVLTGWSTRGPGLRHAPLTAADIDDIIRGSGI
ncbi:TetR/AcrR family transcriptional regulator [Streptomyces sp. B93]|uniref:TetR/AcrR family transcriptional regulator n=1 Tax=Streptomyces sp. B93 TaxID=2824875 RepID=UPI001B38C3DE|nr:TetR/AcrR family transcriptional regulator [Streptomyces sp. B93]MBQ1090084.1 TetR/AcrR family transcriptional regulator [Streptomyces sp. B93]